MPRNLIVFAHPLEAAPTIERLGALPIEGNHLYEFDRGKILICGLGSVAAAAHTASHLNDVDRVWNFGLAGALREDIPVGEVRACSLVGKHLSFPEDISYHSVRLSETAHPTLPLEPVGWALVSANYPIWDHHMRDKLSDHYDIVDMEGYGIATAAATRGLPCHLWKIVSDHAQNQGWPDLKARIEKLSTNLAEIVQREVAN